MVNCLYIQHIILILPTLLSLLLLFEIYGLLAIYFTTRKRAVYFVANYPKAKQDPKFEISKINIRTEGTDDNVDLQINNRLSFLRKDCEDAIAMLFSQCI